MTKSPLICAASVLALMVSMPALAETVDNAADFFTKGAAGLDFRYRLELVDQDGLAENATASTLLTKLHYETATYKGFSGFIEAEHIAVVGKTTYNNSLNG
ncbi:MAG: hypothetical protein EP335_11460, partial [Alphaproteobacteria bacterium]